MNKYEYMWGILKQDIIRWAEDKYTDPVCKDVLESIVLSKIEELENEKNSTDI